MGMCVCGRDEALASGYLTGVARYRHAEVAGETPDPAWAIEPDAEFPIKWLVEDVIAKRNSAHASRLYEALRCRGDEVYEDEDLYELDARLALLAALTGRRGSMHEYLRRSAKALDGAPVF